MYGSLQRGRVVGNGTPFSEKDREALVNALKSKLQDLAGQHADVLESLTPTVRKRELQVRKEAFALHQQHDSEPHHKNHEIFSKAWFPIGRKQDCTNQENYSKVQHDELVTVNKSTQLELKDEDVELQISEQECNLITQWIVATQLSKRLLFRLVWVHSVLRNFIGSVIMPSSQEIKRMLNKLDLHLKML